MIYTLWCHTGDCEINFQDADTSAVRLLGWVGLVVVLLVAVAIVFAYLSKRKRKIRTLDEAADQGEQAPDSASEHPS
jgi:flagellar biosynthesis/type III secretory pathway M-ring protein FliF/YscJ